MLRNPEFDASIVDWLHEHAQRGYITTDSALVVRSWNRWLENKSGITSDAIVGRPLFEVFPELITRQLDVFYRDALEGQVSILSQRFHKYLIKMPCQGSELPEMQQTGLIAPLLRDGNIIGTITVIDDVTERFDRESELLAAREEANEANRAKDRFIAVLSHDLRTPLTAILGWSRVFRERAKDERMVLKGADVIERNAALQLALIEKILDISRINTAKLELDIEPVDIPAAVYSSVESLEPVAESQGIRIERRLPSREGKIATLDAKRFQQIIWNLISNALKFTPEGGTVRVTLEYAPDAFELTVADTGKGISPENLPRIFEPLWQDEGSGGHGGLGIGLAIVKNLVHLHGGTITVQSGGVGLGATFIVRMPWSAKGGLKDSSLHTRAL